MAYRRTRKRGFRRRRRVVPRKTQSIRRLAGQSAMTMVERMAQMPGSLGQLAGSVVMLKKFINSEVKFKDTTISGSIGTGGLYQVLLNGISEGDEYNNRQGRSILMKDLSVRFKVQSTLTNSNIQSIGWAIVLDKKPDETTPCTWGNVFTLNSVFSHVRKQDYSGRFVVMARGQLNINYPDNPSISTKRYINLNGIHIKYDGTDATQTSLDQNAIHFIATTDQTADTAIILGEARLNYYDN